MRHPQAFDFTAAIQIDSLYQPDRFFGPFFVFAARLESLQRHFVFTAEYAKAYLSQSRTSLNRMIDGGASAEALDVHGDMTANDEEYFMEYTRASTLSHLFALLEGLLTDTANEVAIFLGHTVELPNKPMPYINRYVSFLQQTCGLSFSIDRETWRTLDALREVRNRHIHQLKRDMPREVQRQLQKLVDSAATPETEVDDVFVRTAFLLVGKLATDLDAAYWRLVATNGES